MDDQFLQLKNFQQTLEQFNDRISASWKEVETAYEDLDPHWEDENHRKHEQLWLPVQEQMKNYLNRQSPVYTDFLNHKLQVLERYLNGG
ncbi:MAG: hypothetical protein F6K24_36950 [Okeania sp. SIO2D1]|nr:hypothetical protein [Okeania sp. SIO2D1]